MISRVKSSRTTSRIVRHELRVLCSWVGTVTKTLYFLTGRFELTSLPDGSYGQKLVMVRLSKLKIMLDNELSL